MFLFGKSKKDENSLRSGTVEKTISRMIAVPFDAIDISDPAVLKGRLKDTDELKFRFEEDETYVTYKEIEYYVQFGDMSLKVAPDDPTLDSLSESTREAVLNARRAVYVDMVFSENNMESFHLQIKLLNMLVPNMAALMDCASYRMHPGRWAVLTAESAVPPSPEYMFVMHAVNDKKDNGKVWLHTHGLNRCGTIELEILGANTENANGFGTFLNNVAARLIGDNKFIDEKEPFLAGVSTGNEDIVVTWQRSEWALKDFRKKILGGKDDRDEEHDINMGVLYVYAREKDVMEGKLTSVLKREEQLTNNAIYYKSTEETQRMRALALERMEYLKKISEAYDERVVLIKIGLNPDPKYDFDPDYHEYIWFEAVDMRENDFSAVLTQDAYYVDDMKEGVKAEFSYDDVVDWRVFTQERTFYPENVYLFE